MAKQLTGEILILSAKQSCIGYLLRLRMKTKYLSAKTSTLESLEQNEGDGDLGRQQLHIVEVIKTWVLHSGSTARLPQGVQRIAN